jgi:hypothetical protein
LFLLRRELTETAGLNLPLASCRRHGAQAFDRASHRVLTIHREAVEALPHSPEILLLLRRKVLPGLHAPKDLLLPIRRHAIEALQALLQLLLALGGKPPELRITFESAPLLIQGLIPLLI